ncbi:MAG: hypothetical protein R3A47_01050 [Polyangiales bacterium]
MKTWFWAMSVGFLILGCGRESSAVMQVKSAASSDLACGEDKVTIVDDRPTLKRVEGCGRARTYMYRCRAVSHQGGLYGENTTVAAVQECLWAPVEDKRDKQPKN